MSSNNIGSIYATTISSEKYIVIDSQNIELSGNVIMKTNVTINNGSFNTNSLIPNVNNSASLGSTSTSWSNAYFHDLSVNNNLQVLGNVKIDGNLDVSNIYTKNYIDNSFANVYTRSQITASFENVYTLRQIDLSFQNVNISREIDLSFANVYTRTHVDLSFANVHTLREIDLSFQNVYIRRAIDLSFANVNISGQIDQSFANVHTRGYIDTSFQNVYIRRAIDLSFANVNISGQIDASFRNIHTRGYVDTSFQNVYTRGVVDTSFQNVYTRGVIDTSFRTLYTRLQVDNSFNNVHTRRAIDLSYANIYIRRAIDLSFANVNISGEIDQSFANVYTRGQLDLSFRNIYIRSAIDQSFQNVYTRSQADLSFVSKRAFELSYNALAAISGSGGGSGSGSGGGSTIVLSSISGDIIPTLNNTYNLGSTTKFLNNSYINNLRVSNRGYQNINSGPFYEINSTVQTWEWHRSNAIGLGKSLATILSAEQNEKVRLLLVAGGISTALIGASRTATSSAGGKTSTDWQWVNGDIWSYTNFNSGEPNGGTGEPVIEFLTNIDNGKWNDIGSGATRVAVYMSYVEDPSWAAVNGYYGLAKDAYPALNPLSSGVKAVQTWKVISSPLGSNFYFYRNCWCPELRIFVFLYRSSIAISSNGINYRVIANNLTNTTNSEWQSICWSPELKIFVACGYASPGSPTFMRSSDGIIWSNSTFTEAVPQTWQSICWSPELRLFVAVGGGYGKTQTSANVATSTDGVNWQQIFFDSQIWLFSVLWCPELKIFIAGGSNIILRSTNGTTWINDGKYLNYQVNRIDCRFTYSCWSPQLGIFVFADNGGGGPGGAALIHTSSDGITWTRRDVPTITSYSTATSIAWSPQLGIFFVTSNGSSVFQLISTDGINWKLINVSVMVQNGLLLDCNTWSPELGIFCGGSGSNVLISSLKGRPPTSYNVFDASANASVTTSGGSDATGWTYNAWTDDASIGLDSASSYNVAVNLGGDLAIATTINNVPFQAFASSGTNFSIEGGPGVANSTNNNISGASRALANDFIYGSDVYTVTLINLTPGQKYQTTFLSLAWDGGGSTARNQTFSTTPSASILINPNIYGYNNGIVIKYTFIASSGTQVFTITASGASGYTFHFYALANRLVISTSNVSSNSIDENGTWTFANVATTGTLTVNTTPYNSDDRIKHNESVIVNGLAVIDKLCPKFYQKTQTLLDASYNGDLSGQAWTYEAGLIAQEVLQVPELSFVVGGGDYYYVNHILRSKLNPPSYPLIYYEQKWNYDLSFAISYYQQKMNTDLSFDASYNTLQILSDLRMDASYNILKMNNDLIFDACYNEQKSNNDLSNSDLSYSYYYELSNNVITQPYTLNYNSIFVYGLAAIKELHAKVKAQELSLLTQQTIINSLTTRMEALETNPNSS